MKKYVAVMNIPSPYRLHSLAETWRQLSDMGIDFHCHFMAKGHADRPASWLNPKIEFPHTYWRDFGFGEHHFNPSLISTLWREQPDYLFCSDPFATFTGIAVMLGCMKSKRLAWCEGNTQTPGRLGGVLGWIKRLVYSSSQNIIVPGEEGAKYVALHRHLTSKTLPPCVFHPNLVDERRFKPRGKWVDSEIEKARSRMLAAFERGDASHVKICLIPARLVSVKGIVEFLSLLEPDMLKGWKIAIMGEGPLHDEILTSIEARSLRGSVALLEPVAYDEMPLCYAAADLMLLSSIKDRNPLTVIEAIHSGLPLALSCKVGNLPEAVHEGENGWVLHVDDRERFANELRQVFSSDIEELKRMGEVSYSKYSSYWNTHDAIARYLTAVL